MPCSQMMSMNMSPPRPTAARKLDSTPAEYARIRNSGSRNMGWSERSSITAKTTRRRRPPPRKPSTRGLVQPMALPP
jgi:hypothetical protein